MGRLDVEDYRGVATLLQARGDRVPLVTAEAKRHALTGEARVMHSGGQDLDIYKPFDPKLFAGMDVGSLAFGERYNTEGWNFFLDPTFRYRTEPVIEIASPVGGLGYNFISGTENQTVGVLQGPLGQKKTSTKAIEVICAALVKTASGKWLPIAVSREAIPTMSINGKCTPTTPWSVEHETFNADMRAWNTADPTHPYSAPGRLVARYQPLLGGRGHPLVRSRF